MVTFWQLSNNVEGGMGESRIFSVRPGTESALFQVHVWNSIEIARAAIELLAFLMDIRPTNRNADAVLEVSLAVLAQALEKANRIA